MRLLRAWFRTPSHSGAAEQRKQVYAVCASANCYAPGHYEPGARSSQLAGRIGPYPSERGPAVKRAAVERREARAQPMGAPRLSGRGLCLVRLFGAPLPSFPGAKKETTARPRRKQ